MWISKERSGIEIERSGIEAERRMAEKDVESIIKTRRLVKGVKQVCRAAEEGKLELVILALDADAHIKQKAISTGIEILDYPSKAALGTRLNIDVPCATAGVLKLNE